MNKNNFLSDYSYQESRNINMSVSGTFLASRSFQLSKEDVFNNLDQYPSNTNKNKVIKIISKKYKIQEESILLGPGANGILQNFIKILLKPNNNIVTTMLTFPPVVYGAQSFGNKVKLVELDKDFCTDLEKIKKSIDNDTSFVYLSNPNNPTGTFIESSKIIEFCKNVKCVVIVDESGIAFSESKSLLDYAMPNNLIVLRSFSKSHGLAGIRVGFAVCSSVLKNKYLENISNNELSNISLVILEKALLTNDDIQNINLIKKERQYLCDKLKAIGISYITSYSNTIFIKNNVTKKFINELDKNDISVVVVPYMDKNYIRIAVSTHQNNMLFIEKISKIWEKSK